MPLDIDDFKPNSHKSKEKRPESEKKAKKVVENPASVRKKSRIKKIVSGFFADDIEDMKSYLINEVVIPAVKDAVLDSVKALLGKGSSTKSKNGNVSYRKYYEDKDERNWSGGVFRSRNVFDYDEIVFKTRGDAELALDQMEDIIARYGVVSVLDLYDIADVENDNPMTGKYGWTHLRNAFAMRVEDGYILKLPKALPLD